MHLDLVLPAHNEEQRIGRTLHRYRHAVPDADTRFVVALDGCSDGTADVVRDHQAIDPRVVLLELPKLGKGGAIAEGLRRCTAPLVGFVDADGATPPAELVRLAEAVSEGADVAIASRWHPSSVTPGRRPLGRRLASAGFARAVRRLFDLPHLDTQCGAKVLTFDAAARITPLLSSRDFLVDVDLLVAARDLGLTVTELPTVWVDQDGSKLDAARDARRMAASALRLWLHHRVLPRPRPGAVPAWAAAPATARSTGAVIDLTDRAARRSDGELVPA